MLRAHHSATLSAAVECNTKPSCQRQRKWWRWRPHVSTASRGHAKRIKIFGRFPLRGQCIVAEPLSRTSWPETKGETGKSGRDKSLDELKRALHRTIQDAGDRYRQKGYESSLVVHRSPLTKKRQRRHQATLSALVIALQTCKGTALVAIIFSMRRQIIGSLVPLLPSTCSARSQSH